jgi:hypothetical protein
MKQRLWIGLLLLIIGALSWLLLTSRNDGTVTIKITQAMIDAALTKKFPQEKSYLKFLRVSYANPQAILLPDQDKVLVSMDVTVHMGIKGLEKSFTGAAAVSTRVKYNATDYKFYLQDATLRSLDIPKLSAKDLDLIKEGINLIAAEFVDEVPIYKLSRNDTKTNLAKLLLKNLTIKQDKVVVTLGL